MSFADPPGAENRIFKLGEAMRVNEIRRGLRKITNWAFTEVSSRTVLTGGRVLRRQFEFFWDWRQRGFQLIESVFP
jgi:hypothetical protein